MGGTGTGKGDKGCKNPEKRLSQSGSLDETQRAAKMSHPRSGTKTNKAAAGSPGCRYSRPEMTVTLEGATVCCLGLSTVANRGSRDIKVNRPTLDLLLACP